MEEWWIGRSWPEVRQLIVLGAANRYEAYVYSRENGIFDADDEEIRRWGAATRGKKRTAERAIEFQKARPLIVPRGLKTVGFIDSTIGVSGKLKVRALQDKVEKMKSGQEFRLVKVNGKKRVVAAGRFVVDFLAPDDGKETNIFIVKFEGIKRKEEIEKFQKFWLCEGNR